jgi:N-acetylmuramic acid 6-phosphate etherase
MVNMQLSNEKLVDRGVRMVMEKTGMEDYSEVKSLLLQYGSVKKVIDEIAKRDQDKKVGAKG